MKRLVLLLVSLIAAGVLAAGAGGNRSPYSPGLVQGWAGVAADGGTIRYLTVATARHTIVMAVRVRDGRVLRTTTIRGYYGVPILTYDGRTGGVSGDGRTLVLSSYGPYPGSPGATEFVTLDTRSLELRREFELRGSWAFDAVSPNGSTLFLIEYLAAGTNPRYKVRALDAKSGRLAPDAIVDRREDEALMRGQPVTRVNGSADRWAYTLYARPRNEPFVHALDTERREAYCIDLPLELGVQRQLGLRLKAARDGDLRVFDGRRIVAVVDTEKLSVRTS